MFADKKTLTRLLLIFAVVLTATAGCSRGDKAAAIVNGISISVEELDDSVSRYRDQYAAQGQPIPDEQLPAFRSSILESLIRKSALLSKARELEISIADEEIEAEIQKIRDQFTSDDQFKEAISGQGYKEDDLRAEIRDDLTASAVIDSEVLEAIDIPEDDVVSFFEENSQYFITPESVTASHILIQVAADASSADIEKAEGKINDILEELKAGADFAELAKKRSEGPSGPNGGSLGTFGRGQMVPPFEEAAFALEPGELSGAVKTEFGYHVILVSDKTEANTRTFEEVRDDILDFLRQSEGDSMINDYVESLVTSAEIERLISD